MTIASAFNEIAVANGGTADNSGTIAGAVDALTDALAGSDVAQGATIEDGVRVLGEYIGGGGGTATVYIITSSEDVPQVNVDGAPVAPESAPELTLKTDNYKIAAPIGAIVDFGGQWVVNTISIYQKLADINDDAEPLLTTGEKTEFPALSGVFVMFDVSEKMS